MKRFCIIALEFILVMATILAIVCIAATASAQGLGIDTRASGIVQQQFVPPQLVDMPTPAVKITNLKPVQVVRGSTIPIEIRVQNYNLDASLASPLPIGYNEGNKQRNTGHYHVYVSSADGAFNRVVGFSGATNSQSIEVAVPGPGWYRVLVELEHNDHTRRTKMSPRDWPPIDFAIVRVVAFKRRGRR